MFEISLDCTPLELVGGTDVRSPCFQVKKGKAKVTVPPAAFMCLSRVAAGIREMNWTKMHLGTPGASCMPQGQ